MPSSTTAVRNCAYASMMVAMHLGESARNIVQVASELSERFDSRLIGIAAEDIVVPYYGEGAAGVDAVLLEAAERQATENLAKAEALFRQAASRTNSIEWRSAACEPLGFILAQSRAADIVVVGRQGFEDRGHGRMAVAPGELVMGLGRPILVVPPLVDKLSGRHVVIAWKDTREARRAVWDALPLLHRAELVWVVSVGAGAQEQGGDDLCRYLATHNVQARNVVRSASVKYDVDEIVDLALEQGADLIVSGAYGHSRMREWLFGGMTNDLLDASPVCCLMSH